MNKESPKSYIYISILTNIITLLFSPIIARIYSIEDFGEYYNSLFLGSFIYIAFSFNLEALIPFLKVEKNRYFLANNILKPIGIVFIIFFFISLNFTDKFNYSFALLIASGNFIGKSAITNYISEKKYKKTSYLRVIQSSIYNVTKLIGGLINEKSLLTLSEFFQYIFYFRTFSFSLKRFKMFWKTSRSQISKHVKFGYPQSLIDASYESLVPILISIIYGEYIIGVIYFLFSKLQALIQLVTTSLTQVFSSEFRYFNTYQKIKTLKETIAIYSSIMILIYVLMIFFGEDLIKLIFGEKWIESYVFLEIGFVMVYFKHLSALFGFIPVMYMVQNKGIIFSVLRATLSFILLYFSFLKQLDVQYMWKFFTILVSIISLSQIIWYYTIIKKNEVNF